MIFGQERPKSSISHDIARIKVAEHMEVRLIEGDPGGGAEKDEYFLEAVLHINDCNEPLCERGAELFEKHNVTQWTINPDERFGLIFSLLAYQAELMA